MPRAVPLVAARLPTHPPSAAGWRCVVVAWCLGLGLLGVVDLWFDRPALAVSWWVLGPLLLSWWFDWPTTSVVAAVAVSGGMAVALLRQDNSVAVETTRLLGLVLLAGFAVLNALRRSQRDAALQTASQVAGAAQAAILRPLPPRLGPVALAYRYLSATDGARVGGDLYEAVEVDGEVWLLVGDVRGKGLPAVRLAAVAVTAFREAVYRGPGSLVEVAMAVDGSICREGGLEDFVTAVFCRLAADGTAEIVNCGHPPPLRVGVHRLEPLVPTPPTVPLGLGPCPLSGRVRLQPGERVLLYSDGLVEARDSQGRMFAVEEHARLLATAKPPVALGRLLDAVLAHLRHRVDDDLVAVLLSILPATPAPRAASNGRHRTTDTHLLLAETRRAIELVEAAEQRCLALHAQLSDTLGAHSEAARHAWRAYAHIEEALIDGADYILDLLPPNLPDNVARLNPKPPRRPPSQGSAPCG